MAIIKKSTQDDEKSTIIFERGVNMSLLSKEKCWYVRTDKEIVSTQAQTYAQALFLADFWIANKHTGVQIFMGQAKLEIKWVILED